MQREVCEPQVSVRNSARLPPFLWPTACLAGGDELTEHGSLQDPGIVRSPGRGSHAREDRSPVVRRAAHSWPEAVLATA